MSDTIFTVELPLVETQEELEKVIKKFSQYDPYYIRSGCIIDLKKRFDKLWVKYREYADSHFLKEIKENFHQRTWEMYVGNVLLEKKLNIESKDVGPDFIITNSVYIECTAPTNGDPKKNPDFVPKIFIAPTPKEICSKNVPVDKIILRITQSIKDKALDQYKNWKNKKWIDLKTPFVIAVNTGGFGYSENSNLPSVIKALFGIEFIQINSKTGAKTHSFRREIEKSNKSRVPVDYFIKPDFDFVSGVLFSNVNVLDHPKNIGDDCIFVNNPFAKNPVDESFIGLFQSWTKSKENDGIISRKPPQTE